MNIYPCIILLHLTYPTFAHFAVIGDWGGHLGTEAQKRVAASLELRNPDFVISTGDNFYPDGIEHAIDNKIKTLWSDIYNVTTRTWYSVLGNHDYLKNATAQLHIDLRNGICHLDIIMYLSMIWISGLLIQHLG